MTVAIAAPLTFMPSAKMNTGSSAMLSAAPMMTDTMEMTVNPCAEIKTLSPSAISTKIVPSA